MFGFDFLKKLALRFRVWIFPRDVASQDIASAPEPREPPSSLIPFAVAAPSGAAEVLVEVPLDESPLPVTVMPDRRKIHTSASVHAAKLRQLEKNRRRYDVFLEIQKAAPIERDKPSREETSSEAIEATSAEGEVMPYVDPLGTMVIVQKTARGDNVRIAESEINGEFNFRDTILDQLDRYFLYAKRMRKRSPDAYAYYKRVGITLLPFASTCWDKIEKQFTGKTSVDDNSDKIKYERERVPPFFLTWLPSFGCFAYGTDTLTETREIEEKFPGRPRLVRFIPKFIYFHKYHKPPYYIQPMPENVAIYAVTIIWDRPFDKHKKARRVWKDGSIPQDYAIAVMPDGKISALRMLSHDRHVIGRTEFWTKDHDVGPWQIPRVFGTLGNYTNQKQMLESCFADCARWHESSSASMFRVEVRKDGIAATFTLNPLRASYFFADRDLQIDKQGRKIPIFHEVRPHKRADGTYRKAHFRGTREFKWAGYDVLITVPGLHHQDLNTFNAGSDHFDKLPKKQDDLIKQGEIGKAFARHIHGETKDPIDDLLAERRNKRRLENSPAEKHQ